MEGTSLNKRYIADKSAGSAGTGVLLLFAVALTSFLIICEFFFAFSVRDNLEAELTRAANIAVDMAMSDAYRQDRLSELDADAAYTQFYDYLYNEMRLPTRLGTHASGVGGYYSLEITELVINPSLPGVRATASVSLQPLFLGRIVPITIRFNIRVSSVNRRKD